MGCPNWLIVATASLLIGCAGIQGPRVPNSNENSTQSMEATVESNSTAIPPQVKAQLDAIALAIAQTSPDEMKKHLSHANDVLDCLSVGTRDCGRVYPKDGNFEFCNLINVRTYKDEGLQRIHHQWRSPRHEGILIMIRVRGDPLFNREAHGILHIDYHQYPKNLPETVVQQLRVYCNGMKNHYGEETDYAHCFCHGAPFEPRKKYCHIYRNGKLIRTEPRGDC